ncbi:MFS transporter [Actinoallomurus purpureus]|uniref:MFS transporter n=1 Tax=Actinoallomurus purpureus TaxID=478114 RepID=UPI0020920BA0|nr:MFS transporter [Actinoallomurus purpureus]MCO6004380.1 MFS transporter [Actinoallomurus purpureus]
MNVRAGKKVWIGLAVLVLPCLIVSMDVSVLLFGMPFISADLKPSGTQLLWIMDMYGFVLAGMLITMGALGDRIGRRRLLLIGAVAFSAASVAAAYSTGAGMLIGTRAVLGLAGATLMPSTLALIRNMFHDERQRKTAIAVWTGAMTGGVTVGPIVGGALMNHFWWGSAFLINVPAMVLLLALGPVLLPEFRNPAAGRFDVLGSLLSLGAVLPIVYGIKELAIDGYALLPVISIVVGLAVGVVFWHRQRTIAHPLIDLSLFRHRTYSASVGVNTVTNFAMLGFSFYTMQYLQVVHGMSPFKASLWSLAVMPFIMVAMTVAGIAAKKVRPAFVIATGLLVSACGLVVTTQVDVHQSLAVILTGAGLLAAGMLVATSLTADLILTAAPAEQAGAASAVAETGSELGGALGFAILGSIGTAVYHHQMADVQVAGIPAETLRAARDTLGSAAHVPGQAGQALLETARTAFTHGLNITGLAGAMVLVPAALIAFAVLRNVPVTAPAKDTAPAEQTPELEPTDRPWQEPVPAVPQTRGAR